MQQPLLGTGDNFLKTFSVDVLKKDWEYPRLNPSLSFAIESTAGIKDLSYYEIIHIRIHFTVMQ